ncbi:MAG: NrfD/PsrC family molybdoenzyme membrane anchor subunit [Thermoleophilia bacterium]
MANYYFSRIEGKSASFWTATAICAGLVLAWLVATLIRFLKGYYLTGMSNSVTWAGDKVIFVLFVGLSAGSLMISGLAVIFKQKEYKVLSRVAAFNSVLFMVAALGALISGWGRPDRIFLPFYMVNPRSLLSLNAFIYMSYMAIGTLYLWAQFKENDRWTTVMGTAAVVAAVFVHSGTGFIFGIINGRDMYFSSITPLAFVVAALSSGTALAMVMLHLTFKYTKRPIDQRFFLQLSKIMLGLMIFVFYLVTIEHLTHLYDPEFQHGETFVMFGGNFFTFVFWIQLYLVGLLIPIFILFNPKTKGRLGWILAASVMHVIGVLGERMLFILPGQVLAQPIMPGYELSSGFQDGMNVMYIPRLIEWIQYAGIFALIGLVYLLGLKLLPLLPREGIFVKPVHAEEPAEEAEEEESVGAVEGLAEGAQA